MPGMPTNSVLAPLLAFREAVYAALGPRRDALFDLLDALLVCGSVPSLAHLSLAPAHRRGHGSLYAALAHGGLDPAALRPLLAAQPLAGGAALYAVDVSVWPRPTARTSPQRGYCHASARQGYGRPVVAGWAYQWISQLDLRRDSWTAPVEVARVPPSANANAVAAQQIAGLCRHLARAQVWPDDHLLWFLFDAGYDVTQLARALEDALRAGRLALLVRVRADRCFRADPPPTAPKTPGRPRVHGAPFKCADPTTWPRPTAEHTTMDA
jgi:DDE superfamily endonuclease